MHVSPWWCDEGRMTVLFLAGIYYTHDRPLVQPKMEEWTSLCFPLRNNAGTSGLFFFSVPITVILLVKRKFASSHLVKKLLEVTTLPVPYMWQTITFTAQRSRLYSLTPLLLSVCTCMLQAQKFSASAATHNLIPYFHGFDFGHLPLTCLVITVDFLQFCHWNKLHLEFESTDPLPLLYEKSVWRR